MNCKTLSVAILTILLHTALFAQNEMTMLGNLPYDVGLNDVWGYADEAGNEYALVGLTTGISIVDVTDPTVPTEVVYVARPDGEGIWRDMKTWSHYAYSVNETGGGLLVMDLQHLPDSVVTETCIADSLLKKAHNIWIDEGGFMYVVGYNGFTSIPTEQRGALIFNLNNNPMKPLLVGSYNAHYVHDTYVRDNMMYNAEVYEGKLRIVDVSDKANPVVVASRNTPNSFTHNTWLSDDGSHIFTTDERNNAFVAAYDITNLGDMKETDRYQSSPGQNVMPHNVHVRNDFLVTSYYKDGVRVIDANEPTVLVETEFYDSSPLSGSGSSGAWGAYPFLPSGNILISDRQEGLFIVQPNYQRAAYLEGTVTNAETGAAITDVEVQIVSKPFVEETGFGGTYKTGAADAGTYEVRFYKYGFEELIVSGVELATATFTQLDVELQPRPSFVVEFLVTDSETGNPLEGVNIFISIPEIDYELTTDEDGRATVIPFYSDYYDILVTNWGWHPLYLNDFEIDFESSFVEIELQKGYLDDFSLDFGWNTAITDKTVGGWVRGEPVGTVLTDVFCNPEFDIDTDLGDECYMTGNGGGDPEDSDLDGGVATLTSPTFDLSDYPNPHLSFYWWFCTNSTDLANDNMIIELHNGTDVVTLETINIDSTPLSDWNFYETYVEDVIVPTDSMTLTFTARATTPSVVTDAAIDLFMVQDTSFMIVGIEDDFIENRLTFNAYPNPFGENILIEYRLPVATQEKVTVTVFDILGQKIDAFELDGASHTFEWGATAAPGIYFIKMGEHEAVKVVKQF